MSLFSSAAVGAVLVTVALTGTVTAHPAAAATTTYAVTHAGDPYSGRSVVVRWTPCLTVAGVSSTHPISYAVNTGGDPSRVTLVQHALAEVTSYSGLRFRYVGERPAFDERSPEYQAARSSGQHRSAHGDTGRTAGRLGQRASPK